MGQVVFRIQEGLEVICGSRKEAQNSKELGRHRNKFG